MAKQLVDAAGILTIGGSTGTQFSNATLSETTASLEESAAEDTTPEVLLTSRTFEMSGERYTDGAAGEDFFQMSRSNTAIFTDSAGVVQFSGDVVITGRSASEPARQAAKQSITLKSNGTPTVAPAA